MSAIRIQEQVGVEDELSGDATRNESVCSETMRSQDLTRKTRMGKNFIVDRTENTGPYRLLDQSTFHLLYDRTLQGLLKRVRGYVVREVKTTYEYDSAGEKRIKSEVVTRKRQGPDLSAIIFVLTNIDSQHWRAKGFTEQDQALNPVALPDFSALTDPELQELAGWGDIQNED